MPATYHLSHLRTQRPELWSLYKEELEVPL
jgi:hypothetical protein